MGEVDLEWGEYWVGRGRLTLEIEHRSMDTMELRVLIGDQKEKPKQSLRLIQFHKLQS